MKVLLINNFFTNSGGAEKVFFNEAELLKTNGHDVFYFSINKKPYVTDKYEYNKYFPSYINYYDLSLEEQIRNTFRPFYNIEAKENLAKLLMKIKPDVVHVHNIHYHLTPAVIDACKDANVPTVMTVHDVRLFCPSGTLMKSGKYCQGASCLVTKNPLNCILNKCKNGSLKASIFAALDYLFVNINNFYSNVDYFIFPSQALLDIAVKANFNKDKLININNYISDEFLNKTPNYYNEGYFLFVGRLSREKGLNFLLKAMKDCPKAKLKIVGSGQEEENLKKLATKLKLTNIEFCGYKEKDELDILYKNCIATILPCNWFENEPLSIIESFTYGKPVIASHIGGIPDMVTSNVNGFTVQPANPEKLSEAINKFITNPELAKEFGVNARQKAEQKYTASVHYEKLINLYQMAIKSKND